MLHEIKRASGMEQPTEDDSSASPRKKGNLVQYLVPVHPVHQELIRYEYAFVKYAGII